MNLAEMFHKLTDNMARKRDKSRSRPKFFKEYENIKDVVHKFRKKHIKNACVKSNNMYHITWADGSVSEYDPNDLNLIAVPYVEPENKTVNPVPAP